MKMLVMLEMDVSKTIARTMQRSGFILAPDGSSMQIKVPNCPTIPQRKTHIAFVEDPNGGLTELLLVCTHPPGDLVSNECHGSLLTGADHAPTPEPPAS